MEALKSYSLLLSRNPDGDRPSLGRGLLPHRNTQYQDIVKGIIEGETRAIVSCMTMEEIFKERQVYKQKINENIQNELNQFGLRIYNANIKELQDAEGSEYFSFLSRKAHEGASNQAKIDVAQARMRGVIRESEAQGRTKQEVSKIDAETAVLETKRKGDKAQADAELMNRQTELNMTIELNQIHARRQAEGKDAELQKHVEKKKAKTELEQLRATDVTRSKIAREIAQGSAGGAYYTKVKNTDATIYQKKQDAKMSLFRATKDAEAQYILATKEADSQYYAKKREADGLMELAKAYGAMGNALGGPQGLQQHMMLQNGTYEALAKANATAINGLQPKITVWNTGDQAADSTAAAPVRNLMQTLPPLLSTIQEQTGIKPPTWMAQMPKDIRQEKQNGEFDG